MCVRLTKAELHKNDLEGINAVVHLSSLFFQGDSPTWSEKGNSVANSSEDFSEVL